MSAENRLGNERSSYLKTAAHQPVAWHAWGAEAFERARAENKPILLDIGAVWCHWCHVMDRESYEDARVAALINERFVAVKVDRDERPDVDARYQKAIQAMSGQGGWPLTAFLLPDGRPFYGGTYFPPVDSHGRPSFSRVLASVSEAFEGRRDEILENADALSKHIEETTRAPRADAELLDVPALLTTAVTQMQRAFDAQFGGFGRAPKFPHPASHDLLLDRGLGGDKAALDVVVATLDAMQAGGMYDQLAGGFHRYSVDQQWIVPHFEKMLYDNAGLLRNYARAGAALGREDFRATASEIAAFLRDVLQQDGGGFGGSQDADVGMDDDGDYFTWSLDELRAAIPDASLQRLMASRYAIEERGDMHHDPTRNVLRVAADARALAAALKRPVDDIERDLARGKRLMQEARAKRAAPFVDPIRYASWNGMAIGALLEHGGASGDADVDGMALRALDAFLAEAYDPARGFARYLGSDAYGLLDDNAQMLDALVEAHFATGDTRYLRHAREVADLLLAHFADKEGGFVDRAPALAPAAEAAPLTVTERPVQDAPTASPNGVALAALLRLSDASGDVRYREAAEASLRALAPQAAQLSLFGGALLVGLDRMHRGAPRIVVPNADAAPFRAAARRALRPGATLVARDGPELPEEARAYDGQGAIVCVGTRCLAPAETPEDLEARLRTAT